MRALFFLTVRETRTVVRSLEGSWNQPAGGQHGVGAQSRAPCSVSSQKWKLLWATKIQDFPTNVLDLSAPPPLFKSPFPPSLYLSLLVCVPKFQSEGDKPLVSGLSLSKLPGWPVLCSWTERHGHGSCHSPKGQSGQVPTPARASGGGHCGRGKAAPGKYYSRDTTIITAH